MGNECPRRSETGAREVGAVRRRPLGLLRWGATHHKQRGKWFWWSPPLDTPAWRREQGNYRNVWRSGQGLTAPESVDKVRESWISAECVENRAGEAGLSIARMPVQTRVGGRITRTRCGPIPRGIIGTRADSTERRNGRNEVLLLEQVSPGGKKGGLGKGGGGSYD